MRSGLYSEYCYVEKTKWPYYKYYMYYKYVQTLGTEHTIPFSAYEVLEQAKPGRSFPNIRKYISVNFGNSTVKLLLPCQHPRLSLKCLCEPFKLSIPLEKPQIQGLRFQYTTMLYHDSEKVSKLVPSRGTEAVLQCLSIDQGAKHLPILQRIGSLEIEKALD